MTLCALSGAPSSAAVAAIDHGHTRTKPIAELSDEELAAAATYARALLASQREEERQAMLERLRLRESQKRGAA